ncbi:MAG: hypothetical protein EOO10_02505 [Chitinophagaceae bacterium]|nr:MAG: hypothetical protein EOO10_02505 [Chitinophagaceae bacterium]
MKILILVSLFFIVGCRSGTADYDYEHHAFDQQIVARLPYYDSISRVLIQNFPYLLPAVKGQSAFEYRRSEGSGSLYSSLPRPAVEKINGFIQQLGEKYLDGFDVYKDSSIRFSVRDTYLEKYYVTIRDRLSFYPNGGEMRRREAPDKDTILNPNWQYWIRFDEQGL